MKIEDIRLTPDEIKASHPYWNDISDNAVKRVMEMAAQGADIIDIGGESSRPGAESVSVDEELERTIPVIKKVAPALDIPISIDTTKSRVAREAMENGASIINDITGLRGDAKMADVAREFDASIVIMHMKGAPRTMQVGPHYDSLIEERLGSLKESMAIAKQAGVDENKIIVDPGIGFGKTVQHNLEILNRLEKFKSLGRPILIGVSRKSYITGTLKESNINEEDIEATGRLMGTVSSCAIAIMKGASILRIHDVKETVQAARIADAIIRS